MGVRRSTELAPLDEVPALAALPPRTRRALDKHVDVGVAPARSLVVRAGSSVRWVVFVAAGELVVEDGHRKRLGPGSLYGAVEALSHAPAPATVRVGERGPATLLTMDRRRFLGLVATEGEFALAVLRTIASDLAATSPSQARGRRFESASRRDLPWAS